jgi:putative tryptophan/tyrosine transport system substrate-binding protein
MAKPKPEKGPRLNDRARCWLLRRALIIVTLAVVVLSTPLPVATQPRGKLPSVAVLEPGRAPGAGCLAGFRQGLRELGYIEGQNIAVEYRFAEGKPDRVPILMAELIRQTPNVLWTHSPSAAQAAQRATTTIPIVIGVAGYLVEQGLAASLARPGGNITGFELGDIEVAGKRLQLLKEAVPRISRVAVFVDPTMRAYDGVPKNLEPEARALGVRLERVEAATPEVFEDAFAAMLRARADAVMIVDLPLFVRNSDRLFQLALRHRLPTISGWRRYAEAGSLIAYGAKVPDLCQRSVDYVDRILKGAKPGDLPVEQPTRYELVVNMKTAKTLGLTIPPSVLGRADQVIE